MQRSRQGQVSSHLDVFHELGANPTPMSFSEVFSSLQQGVIDGQENPLKNISSNFLNTDVGLIIYSFSSALIRFCGILEAGNIHAVLLKNGWACIRLQLKRFWTKVHNKAFVDQIMLG